MNGIFGVGIAEVFIVLIALFVIGGPENTAKWAREMGRQVRKLREAWAQIMAEMEDELGPEGKEIMDAARELGKGAREARNMSPTKRFVGETMKMVESSIDIEANTADVDRTVSSVPEKTEDAERSAPENKYTAWIPPKK
jgi:Sec-independent protein translocase protein TatA